MSCASCVASIENSLAKHTGVVSVSVSLMTNMCVVVHDPSIVSEAEICLQINNMGFSDYPVPAQRCLIGLFCWQCLDILIHIAVNEVTVPHALANAVWWVGVPAIALAVEPVQAHLALGAGSVEYLGMVIWFIVENGAPPIFLVIVFISYVWTGGAGYYSTQKKVEASQSADDV
jgi:copper chaperone CopZ